MVGRARQRLNTGELSVDIQYKLPVGKVSSGSLGPVVLICRCFPDGSLVTSQLTTPVSTSFLLLSLEIALSTIYSAKCDLFVLDLSVTEGYMLILNHYQLYYYILIYQLFITY